MNEFQIENDRLVGDNQPPFIIAEIGNNHNGDIKIAFELIKKAKEIGVDAVKFQIKDIESSFSKAVSYTHLPLPTSDLV